MTGDLVEIGIIAGGYDAVSREGGREGTTDLELVKQDSNEGDGSCRNYHTQKRGT